MGVKCQIFRDALDNVAEVVDSNGDISKLYLDALDYTEGDEQQALDLWGISYLEEFPIKGREATLEEVLNYSNLSIYKNLTLTNEEVAELTSVINSNEYNSLDELHSELVDLFYKDGVFSVDEVKLKNSNLYTESEAINIRFNEALQFEIKDTIAKLGGYLLRNTTEKIDTINDVEAPLVAKDNTKLTPIGTFSKVNDLDLNNTLDAILSGVTSMSEFVSKVNQLPYKDVAHTILSSDTNRQRFYDIYKNKVELPIFEIKDDNLVETPKNKTEEKLMETVLVGEPNVDIASSVEIINSLSDAVWDEVYEDVTELLSTIEKEAIKFGIDIVGLTEKSKEKTREEIVGFVNELNNLTEDLSFNLAEEATVSNFAARYNEFFGVDLSQANSYETLSPKNKDLTLIKLDTNLSEVEVFDKFGLVKVEEGLYQKVLIPTSLNTLYDELYDAVLEDNTILPREAYYPSGVDENGEVQVELVNAINGKSAIIRDIRNYINSKIERSNLSESEGGASTEMIAVYKEIYGHKEVKPKKVKVNNLINKINNLTTNQEYLKSEFLYDFNQYVISEKVKDSFVYNKALKYFFIDSNGLKFNGDLEAINTLRVLEDDNAVIKNLKQYTIISKENSIQNLFDFTPEIYNEIENVENKMRAIYSNFPNSVDIYKGEYKVRDGKLIVNGVAPNFIRVNEGVFELVKSHLGNSYYSQVPISEGEFLNLESIPLDTNIRNIEVDNLNTVKAGSKVIELYDKKELEKINEEIDECQL